MNEVYIKVLQIPVYNVRAIWIVDRKSMA